MEWGKKSTKAILLSSLFPNKLGKVQSLLHHLPPLVEEISQMSIFRTSKATTIYCCDEFRRYKYAVRHKRRFESQIDKFYFLRPLVGETGESKNGRTNFNYRGSQSVTTILTDAQFEPPLNLRGGVTLQSALYYFSV
ncbi:hypothetical protein Rgna02_02619 [Mediterraneibacter gnavus]